MGISLGGSAAWDGVGRVNVLDVLPQSGRSNTSHGTTPSKRLCGMTISASALYTTSPKPSTPNPQPHTLNPKPYISARTAKASESERPSLSATIFSLLKQASDLGFRGLGLKV